MSRARVIHPPTPEGRHVVECKRCDSSADFPDIYMAIEARKLHLCPDEVPSCSWPGWELE